jgi:hypothetical protein
MSTPSHTKHEHIYTYIHTYMIYIYIYIYIHTHTHTHTQHTSTALIDKYAKAYSACLAHTSIPPLCTEH